MEEDLTIPEGFVIVLPGTGQTTHFCHAGRLILFLLQQVKTAYNPLNNELIDIPIIQRLAEIMGINLEELYNLVDDYARQSSGERLQALNALLKARQGDAQQLKKRQDMLKFLETQETWQLAMKNRLN